MRQAADNGERTPRRRQDAQQSPSLLERLPSFTASRIARPPGEGNKSLSLLPSMRRNSTCLSEIETELPSVKEEEEEEEGEQTAKKRRLLIQDTIDISSDEDDAECIFS